MGARTFGRFIGATRERPPQLWSNAALILVLLAARAQPFSAIQGLTVAAAIVAFIGQRLERSRRYRNAQQ